MQISRSSKEIIFSASPEFAQTAFSEIQRLAPQSKLIEWLDEGAGLVLLEQLDFLTLSSQISLSKAVFIRHIFPAIEKISLENSERDFEEFERAIAPYLPLLNQDKTVSIQIRFAATVKPSYNRFELRQVLINQLLQLGLTIEAKNPIQIISIFCGGDRAYVGFSEATENLSDWAGGMHRFAHEADQISRAEFKLLEAINLFNLELPEGKALDLGASPGGWTRILRKQGLSVVAVDPGELSETLRVDREITHRRQLVQQFLPSCREQFDIIVNDMRMDAIDSAKIMVSAHEVLKENGLAIMTLKLPNKGVKAAINSAIAQLEKQYEILGIRNLFHNRHEATVVLRSQ